MVSPMLKQTWIASSVIGSLISQGMIVAYPYSLLPALRAKDSPIKIDLDTGSWLASCVSLTGMIGVIVSSALMEWLGRRLAFSILLLPNIIGWIIIYFSKDLTSLMIGRLCGGFFEGSGYIFGPAVMAEYTSPGNRGIFLSLKTTGFCVGCMLIHVISYFFSWRSVALISVFPPVLIICGTWTWPESPFWLATKGRLKQSEKSFFWLRGKDENSVKEFEELIRLQKERISASSSKSNFNRIIDFLRNICKKGFFKPVLIVLVLHISMQSAGRKFFPAYANDIVNKIDDNFKSHTFLVTLVIDTVTVTGSFIISILTKFIKRRSLLFFSAVPSIIILLSLCLYLFLVSKETISIERPWIPFTMLIVYYFFVNLGLSPIPILICGELLPISMKGSAMAISGILVHIPLNLVLKLTPILLAALDLYGMFLVYCLILILSLSCLYFVLPETKNRTLQEVEEFFRHGKFLDEEIKRAGDNCEEKVEMLCQKYDL